MVRRMSSVVRSAAGWVLADVWQIPSLDQLAAEVLVVLHVCRFEFDDGFQEPVSSPSVARIFARRRSTHIARVRSLQLYFVRSHALRP